MFILSVFREDKIETGRIKELSSLKAWISDLLHLMNKGEIVGFYVGIKNV